MASAVEMWQVEKWFGGVAAVANVSIKVRDEECLCLLGPSGCGKTTSLRMIAGLESPDAGRIMIKGEDVTTRPPYERDIGMVFQDYALFPHMTVEQNIAFGLRHRGVARTEIPDRIAAVLDLVRLSGHAARKPAQLSGGQQQRVALARALATRPAVLLLDEPLSNLDTKLREELRVQMREIIRAARTTTIMVTHDQDEAMALGDTVVVMRQGKVEQVGPPLDLYDLPRNRFVAAFMGRNNFLAGVAGEADDAGSLLFAPDAGGTLRLRAPGAPGGRLHFAIRPERLSLVAPGGQGAVANIVEGTLRAAEPLGGRLHLHVDLADGSSLMAAVARKGAMPKPGERIALGFGMEDGVLLPSDGDE